MSDYVANHARGNWYQPGSLILLTSADITGANDWTTASVSAWVELTANAKNLRVTYTPPINCIIEVWVQEIVKHTVDDTVISVGIDVNGNVLSAFRIPTGPKDIWKSGCCMYSFSGTALTVYTIKGVARHETAGTLTAYQGSDLTRLDVKAWAHP